jgi:hypothetical protein
LTLNGTLTFGPNNGFTNTITTKGTDSLFDYIPAVTGLVFDGNVNLTSSSTTQGGDTVSNTDFSKMPLLETLSIRNCTGLSANINLRNCPEITTVDTTGTNINIILPTSTGIQTYTLGKPT